MIYDLLLFCSFCNIQFSIRRQPFHFVFGFLLSTLDVPPGNTGGISADCLHKITLLLNSIYPNCFWFYKCNDIQKWNNVSDLGKPHFDCAIQSPTISKFCLFLVVFLKPKQLKTYFPLIQSVSSFCVFSIWVN